MSTKPIFMATHPRACSTAFERVFMTRRKSLQTIHEPFGDAFYYGPERMGARFEDDEESRLKSGFAESTFKTILDRIEREGEEGKRVFIKDITYYLVPPEHQPAHVAPSLAPVKRGVGTADNASDSDDSVEAKDSAVDVGSPPKTPTKADTNSRPVTPRSPPFPYETPVNRRNPTVVPREILEQFHFTFLIRHPRNSIPSFLRCCIPPLLERTQFHSFMPSEAGYDELKALFDYCKDTGMIGPAVCGQDNNSVKAEPGQPQICVIDADDLLDDPEGILRQYCDSIGVEFSQEMLTWDSEESHQFAREQFEKWDGWHDDAIGSKDLKPRQHKKTPKTDEQLYAEWTEKYGKESADVIKQTVADNVETYEYLKKFAIPLPSQK